MAILHAEMPPVKPEQLPAATLADRGRSIPIADRMRNLIMDPEETMSERDVVMEERRMRYEDDPQNLVFEEVEVQVRSYK